MAVIQNRSSGPVFVHELGRMLAPYEQVVVDDVEKAKRLCATGALELREDAQQVDEDVNRVAAIWRDEHDPTQEDLEKINEAAYAADPKPDVDESTRVTERVDEHPVADPAILDAPKVDAGNGPTPAPAPQQPAQAPAQPAPAEPAPAPQPEPPASA